MPLAGWATGPPREPAPRVLFVIQAAGTALIIRQTRYSVGYDYDQILPWVAIGLGIVASFAIGRYFNKSGEAHSDEANAVRAG